ncbi:hypothetical protein G1H11_12770 [Phytoactinopolyspora alkaliphila]|uniref:Uncharacterized protein n=1 Tax=Phytoactinopolyspora alkaliphila TaxID=1783498 RepID=A0A6N9YMG3_9ACTN|nr:hypothetical protein [Phytoactinopolyspora alkaliphila]NED96183.1 hypothetical protein [Phytoactinopolyspora alkaliphila]
MELAPEPGAKASLDMSMTMGFTIRIDGDSVPVAALPPMLMGMEITVDEVTDDAVAMSFVYDKAEAGSGGPVMSGMQEVQEMLDTLVGVSGTITTTRSGAYIDGAVDLAGLDPAMSGAMDQLEQQLADLAVPLPTEPVGVDAEWEVVSSIESGGITFCNVASYTLAEFDGDSYELDVEVTQNAIPAEFTEGGVPIELKAGTGSLNGRSGGSLSLPVAVSATTEGTSTMTMEVDQHGSTVTQEVVVDVEVEISPRDAESST